MRKMKHALLQSWDRRYEEYWTVQDSNHYLGSDQGTYDKPETEDARAGEVIMDEVAKFQGV